MVVGADTLTPLYENPFPDAILIEDPFEIPYRPKTLLRYPLISYSDLPLEQDFWEEVPNVSLFIISVVLHA